MCTHMVYRLVKANSSQQHTFEEVPNLYSSVQGGSNQLKRVLRAQDRGSDDVRVGFILRSG